MRNFLILLTIILASCKTSQPSVDIPQTNEVTGCILNKLPKMVDYENQIEKYTSIYKDTIFEIESVDSQNYNYKTIIELGASKRYVWLLKTNGNNADSLLIHCVAPAKSVDTFFDLKNCEIELEINEYYENGNPSSGITSILKM